MNRRRLLAFAALAAALLAAPIAHAQSIKSDDDKTYYALGAMLGGQIKSLNLTKEELSKLRAGFEDEALGKTPQVDMQVFAPKAQAWAKKRLDDANEREQSVQKEAARGYLEKAAKESGAQSFPSGLIYKKLREGAGGSPSGTSNVTVHYEGKLVNGKVFDSSYARNEPAKFPLNGVIACWTEGVQKMKVGEKAQLVCPSNIAYGPKGQGSIPPGATLIFTVELISIDQ
jgi:FKBP-type peptidyl-prolyl cis-trans isomerase FkpA